MCLNRRNSTAEIDKSLLANDLGLLQIIPNCEVQLMKGKYSLSYLICIRLGTDATLEPKKAIFKRVVDLLNQVAIQRLAFVQRRRLIQILHYFIEALIV